jgi:hypothetical protein
MAITHQRTDSNTASLGADLTVDLSSDTIGDLAIITIRAGGVTLPTIPGGWTTAASNVSAHARAVAYRVKESGDTTFQFDIAAGLASSYIMDVFRGATWGEIAESAVSVPNGTALEFPALTVVATSASYLSATWTAASGTITVPTNYTSLNTAVVNQWTGWDSTISSGSLDPADGATQQQTANRIGWHIELLDSTTVVNTTKNLGALGVG